MSSHHDQPRPMLPGAAEYPAAPRHHRSRPGRFHRLLSYVLASMRTQPLLTLLTPAMCLVIGVSHLWSTPPAWHVTAEYRIAGTTSDPVPASLRVEVTPAELRGLLVSQPVVRGVAHALEEEAAEALWPEGARQGPLRLWAIDLWTRVRSWPASAAVWLGVAEPSASVGVTAIAVRAGHVDADEQVVRLHVTGASPSVVEAAPALLLTAVRDLLRHEDRARTQARVEELRPTREEGAERLREAADAVTRYRIEIGRQDPEVSANDIQARLIDTLARRAELETDLKEAEANRVDITRLLASVTVEQTARVVVEQNRRVQELKNEISTLEARYAADLAVKTPKHEDMVRLRLEIESKRRDLNNEEILVIREKVQEPSLEYIGLLERQAQNNRQLVTLAGRELGLAETDSRLSVELAQAMQTAQRMEELTTSQQAAEESLRRIDAEMALLDSRLTSIIPFAHLALVGQPHVANPNVPDEPNTTVHMAWTISIALLLMILVPTLRSLVCGRLVAAWQIEAIGHLIPVELVGELPGPVQRTLLRLSGDGGR